MTIQGYVFSSSPLNSSVIFLNLIIHFLQCYQSLFTTGLSFDYQHLARVELRNE